MFKLPTSSHLELTAQEKFGERPKASENTTIDRRPPIITGFRPILSLSDPVAYPPRSRPNVNALAM